MRSAPGTRGSTRPRRNRRQPMSARTLLRRCELGLLVAIGMPILLVIVPTSLGGTSSWTVVVGRSMEPTLDSGDLVVTRAQSDYAVGDVIVYKIPEGSAGEGVMVIHRITGGSASEGFITTGDNREHSDPWRPKPTDIAGKHWRTIPYFGSGIAWLRSPLVMALTISMAMYFLALEFLVAWTQQPHRPRHALVASRPLQSRVWHA